MKQTVEQIRESAIANMKDGSWEKPYDLCRDAITMLFAQAEAAGWDDGFSQEEIKDYLAEVLEKLSNDSISNHLNKLNEKGVATENVINFATLAFCRKVGSKYYYNPPEGEEVDENNIWTDADENKAKVTFVNRDCFLYTDEEVGAQLALTIPTECEKYFPRTVAPKSGLTDIDVLRSAYEEHLHVCLVGECGTGKTLSLKYLAFELQVPYKSVSLDGACTREDLLGTYVRAQRDGKTDWMWVDGWLTKMARYGGIFVAEEINAAPPEILFALHGLLAHTTSHLDLTQIGGDVVEPHPKFFFAATMNPNYHGTYNLNAALLDRFDIVLHYDYDTDLEANFVSDVNVRALFTALRARYPQEITVPPSTRMMQQFEHNRTLFGLEAARNFLINKFPQEEREIVATIFDAKIGTANTRRSL